MTNDRKVSAEDCTLRDAAVKLAAWHLSHQRSLPWRQACSPILSEPYPGGPENLADPAPRRDPYRTWISEIMLQQTQVETVLGYYERWMNRFPDLAVLARAAEAEVLEAWAGLGYYSRARNLLTAAKQVADRWNGRFPWRREDLLELKGVGEYTAGAIASLAFNLPVPILDGNIVRVFSRLYALGFLPSEAIGKKTYWDLARAWAQAHVPALVNEGLMELGALVCTPRNPRCGECPLADICKARELSAQAEFPPAKKRKETEDIAGAALTLFRNLNSTLPSGREVLLIKPMSGEALSGLWTFPILQGENPEAVRAEWRKRFSVRNPQELRPLPVTVTHSITHRRYRLRIYQGVLDLETGFPEGMEYCWVAPSEVERMLVSSLPKKIWSHVRDR